MALPVSGEKRVFDSILGAMGHTPLVRLGRIAKDLPVPLYAKLEFMNPGGSVKDRVGAFIIEQVENGANLNRAGQLWRRPAVIQV
jgi:cystathionine beta-synthase